MHLFTNHPSSVQLTYLQHMYRSFQFSFQLAKGSICSLIHGVFPFLFTTYSSDLIKELYFQLVKEKSQEN